MDRTDWIVPLTFLVLAVTVILLGVDPAAICPHRIGGASKDVFIARTGREFAAGGTVMVYGYIDRDAGESDAGVMSAPTCDPRPANAVRGQRIHRTARCPDCAVSTPRGTRYQRVCRCAD